MNEPIKSPFVWFGGKRKVAAEVWDALGDVDNYVEPFAGSLAVLLGRPHRMDDGQRRAETVNDMDMFLSNFWRAVHSDPDAVAQFCDGPVNEADLFARHLWLVNEGRGRLIANLEADPDWFDAKVAGWWVWGVNAWIGSGWCSGEGPWVYADDGPDEEGNRQRPHLGDAGKGVNRKRPHLGNAGQGVNRKLPHLGNAGKGVNRKLPHLGDAGQAGFNNLSVRRSGLYAYFAALADRLRDVRVCCGDWSRVVTTGALSFGATVGVFLDPPYSGDVRTADLYASDDHGVAVDVRRWAIENGANPRYRIILAGYLAEHDEEVPRGWRRHQWKANVSYQSATSTGGNKDNRRQECLWFSPHCLQTQPSLFGDVA